MQHVTAVVVTYNRIDLLKECVQALREQKVDRDTQLDIFLVDNASTDGTKEWIGGMASAGDAEDRRIYATHLAENTGGAGGSYTGMKWAYEHGADAIWIMDDDTIPQADALQKLLDGMMCAGNEVAPQDEIGFVSSTVLWIDGSPFCQMNRQHYVGQEVTVSGKGAEESALTLQAVDRCNLCFTSLYKSGSGKQRAAACKEYFIWGDDKEYTLRISETYPCYHVKESVAIHQENEDQCRK